MGVSLGWLDIGGWVLGLLLDLLLWGLLLGDYDSLLRCLAAILFVVCWLGGIMKGYNWVEALNVHFFVLLFELCLEFIQYIGAIPSSPMMATSTFLGPPLILIIYLTILAVDFDHFGFFDLFMLFNVEIVQKACRLIKLFLCTFLVVIVRILLIINIILFLLF